MKESSRIRYLGAAYLVYLGTRAIIEKAPANICGQAVHFLPANVFKQAILAELLNPKTILFFLAFLPQFLKSENGSVFVQLTTRGLILVFLGLASTIFFAVTSGNSGGFLRRNPTMLKW